MKLELLTFDAFDGRVGEVFQVAAGSGETIQLRLMEVQRLSQRQSTPDSRDGFSLMFHGPLSHFLPQQIHSLEHAVMDELAIFLVPVGQDSDGYRYQAIFS